jgi:hypothetical protein
MISPIIPIIIMIPLCIILITLVIIKNKKVDSLICRIIIIVLLFIINLRIMIPSSTNVAIIATNLDVLFVIDNTISMIAEDYANNAPRLSAVKEDCKYIVNKLVGARFSVISFNNTSQIITPYTKDSNLTSEAINSIQIMDDFYAKGSSLNIPLNDMISSVKSSSSKPDRYCIIFFISDGEITNEDKLKSFTELNKYVHNGAILGYGTTKGGYMKITDKYTNETSYLEDKSNYPYTKALSKLDETNLKKIAQDIKIDYIHMNDQSIIDNKLKEITKKINNENADNKIIYSYTDIYYIFAIPLCLLLIYELICYKRRLM